MPRPEDTLTKAFDDYADALFRHTCFRIRDRDRATDLTQETFVKAWDYLRGGGEVRQWKSFLYRVLDNLIIDEYRRKKEQSLDALLDEGPAGASMLIAVGSRAEKEEQLDAELTLEKVRTLMLQLPEASCAILTLRYIDGLSPSEIGDVLTVSENAAAVRIHRALGQLKKLCAPITP